jgi:hypothetical protein
VSIDQVNELTNKLDAYKKASEQTMRDADAALQTKTEKMESAMRLMLQDIVDTSVAAMDAVGSRPDIRHAECRVGQRRQ